jgi:hypothetical protein
MRDDWKYIVFEDGTPILFPAHVEHKAIATALSTSLGKPASAGLVRINETVMSGVSVQVFGESMSLGLRMRPGDAWLIEKLVDRY